MIVAVSTPSTVYEPAVATIVVDPGVRTGVEEFGIGSPPPPPLQAAKIREE